MVVPPGIKENYDFTKVDAETLHSQTTQLIDQLRKIYDSVGNLPKEEINYDNVIKVSKKVNYVSIFTIEHFESDQPFRLNKIFKGLFKFQITVNVFF